MVGGQFTTTWTIKEFGAIRTMSDQQGNPLLCGKDVAEALEGYGTYRICPEDFSRDIDGTKYYNIFFKKYD